MFSTFTGPFRVMFEDLKKQTIIILSVTLGILVLSSIIGILIGDHFSGAIFGPIYGLFLIYPFLLYNKTYQYVLSLGGTRKQYLISTIINTVLFIGMNTLILNVIYQLNIYLIEKSISQIHLQHSGAMLESNQPFLYWWIDFLLCIFLFGLFFFINSIWFYFGTMRTVIAGGIIGALFILWFTNEAMSKVIDVFINHFLTFIHIVGFIGLIGMILSYFIMRNGPLERGGHLGRQAKE